MRAKVIPIKLGDRSWKVIVTDKAPRRNGVECDGVCLHDKREIRLHRGMAEKDIRETILHELLHAIFPHCREWWVQEAADQLNYATEKTVEAWE